MSIFIEKEDNTLISKKYRPDSFRIAFKSLKIQQFFHHDVIRTADICCGPSTTSNPKGKTKIDFLKDLCEIKKMSLIENIGLDELFETAECVSNTNSTS